MGLFSLLVPMYISEISPTSLRGALGTCNQLGISTGLVVAFAIGIPTADDLDKREWWRYVAAISAAPVVVLFLGFLLYVPETPRWLLGQVLFFFQTIIPFSIFSKVFRSAQLMRCTRSSDCEVRMPLLTLS